MNSWSSHGFYSTIPPPPVSTDRAVRMLVTINNIQQHEHRSIIVYFQCCAIKTYTNVLSTMGQMIFKKMKFNPQNLKILSHQVTSLYAKPLTSATTFFVVLCVCPHSTHCIENKTKPNPINFSSSGKWAQQFHYSDDDDETAGWFLLTFPAAAAATHFQPTC